MKKFTLAILICLIVGSGAALSLTWRDYDAARKQISYMTSGVGVESDLQVGEPCGYDEDDGGIVRDAGEINSSKSKAEMSEVSVNGEKGGVDAGTFNDGQAGDLSKNIEELLENFDDGVLAELLRGLGQDEQSIFGGLSFKDKLKAIINGDDGVEFSDVFSYLSALFFGKLRSILPYLLVILGICAVFSVVNSMKSSFASESTAGIIRFACISIISVLLFAQIFALIGEAAKTVASMKTQINTVFPLILTFMAATGASGSVAAYTPAVAILGNVLAGIITAVALPCFILAVVFDIVGNLSEAVKLKKMASFFMSTLKWVLGTAFFVFLAFLSVKGITASIRDSVSIRSAKYAISSYVPIIGGYLSEGFNMVMAGSVLIKNAVGLAGIILLLLTVAPLVVGIMVFSLSLTFLGAITEPLGLGGISSILTGIGKTLKSLTAIILGMAFLYFVFLLLTVCTGNLVL